MRCGTKPLRFYHCGTPLQQPGAANVPVSQSAGKESLQNAMAYHHIIS